MAGVAPGYTSNLADLLASALGWSGQSAGGGAGMGGPRALFPATTVSDGMSPTAQSDPIAPVKTNDSFDHWIQPAQASPSFNAPHRAWPGGGGYGSVAPMNNQPRAAPGATPPEGAQGGTTGGGGGDYYHVADTNINDWFNNGGSDPGLPEFSGSGAGRGGNDLGDTTGPASQSWGDWLANSGGSMSWANSPLGKAFGGHGGGGMGNDPGISGHGVLSSGGGPMSGMTGTDRTQLLQMLLKALG